MKLISKYNRINIIATILVLLSASTSYYFIVRFVLIHQLDNSLKVEESEIWDYVQKNNRLPEATNYRDQNTSFTRAEGPLNRSFHNVRILTGRHHESNTYRELIFPIAVQGEQYKTTVTKPEAEVEDLISLIVLITIGVISLLLLILFVANRFLLRKIWQPFYNTLESIKQFNLTKKQELPIQNTDIGEFLDLDAAVNLMTARIIRDYETLRDFADNASHEMQTPLAILNSKLDLLIQDPHLSEKQLNQLQDMYNAIGRLTKLHQSLFLLTKIENNQFAQATPLRFDLLIKEKLGQLEDLISSRHLRVLAMYEPLVLHMNHYLADILLNNLLSNAIRHNMQNGLINISLQNGELVVSNTGAVLPFNETHIFERFKKGDNAEGAGLGLAIVKQICDNYQFPISYHFADNLHSIHIRINGSLVS
jgi:signal transduction histidine kinase